MTKKRFTISLALGAAVALAGCAGGAPSADYDAMLASIMKSSFRAQGIAKVDRLQQDASNAECSQSQGKDLPEAPNALVVPLELAQNARRVQVALGHVGPVPAPRVRLHCIYQILRLGGTGPIDRKHRHELDHQLRSSPHKFYFFSSRDA